MSSQGIKPEQGMLYANALAYIRQLDTAHLRRLNQVIDTEIIRRKVSRTPKTTKGKKHESP